MSFSLTNTTRTKPPHISFTRIANEVIGDSFDVSLVIVGDTKARKLNLEHRQKSYIPNVLSFPLSKESGEIFLNLNQAKKQASDYGMTYTDFITFLFIHSLLHLKGYDHGSTMEHKERYFVKRFVNNNGKNHACGIDIGTHHIKVMACERLDEDGKTTPRIIGVGHAESRGLRHGYIVNVQEITRGIVEAVGHIQKTSGVEIKKAFLGIGGVGLSSLTHQASVMISRGDGEITDLDVDKVLAACEESLPAHYTLNKRILHTIPISYKVDGRVILSRPQGMKGSKLEVRVLFISCIEQHLNDLVEALNNAGLEVEDVMASPLAASLVTLTKAQKIAGCVLANIGAETTSIVVFENNFPISLEVFPIGGIDITHDIALGLRIPIEEAEQLKRGKADIPVSKKKLDEMVSARLADIFDLIEAHLKKIGKSGLLPAGIILTGGTSGISLIEEVAKGTLKLPARIAKNTNMKVEKNPLPDSFWSVSYGLCLFGINQESAEAFGPRFFTPIKNSFIDWIKQFLP